MTDATPTADVARAYHDLVDRGVRSLIGQATGGLAPAAFWSAVADWSMHLGTAPGKQMMLAEKALQAPAVVAARALSPTARTPVPTDRRFASELWDTPPFCVLRDSFMLTEDWWQAATTDVRGMSAGNEAALSFAVRQALDTVAPTNFAPLNPEVLARARDTQGASLVQGLMNLLAEAAGTPPGASGGMAPGVDLAATPGKVVARSHLAELIQYSPATETVHPEPILIVPAWIMKYYIMDLSAHNSMVRWLVGQGHTVFMVSWRNPGAEDRDLGMRDYLEQGPRMALDAIGAITGAQRIHAAGYCLGGTLLAIQAAAMARARDDRLASMTLLAAQVDFSEPGELSLFVSEAQVALLEDLMWQRGYLDGAQMAGAFTMLRSNDLVWSRLIHETMMGERMAQTDLMVWNADTTRMPYRMHSEYLRALFLENRLAHGKYRIDDKTLSLTNLELPIFAVGTERDHVAPWPSVYRIHHLTDADVTFVLTSGGHNAGIISEPGHRHRHYRMATTPHAARYQDHDAWAATAPVRDGSWWEGWSGWLKDRSAPRGAPPPMGRAAAGYDVLGDAPGTYVFQK
ncbi:PHA/PHB synthase family protein [Rhodobaculum claviforme]|uniref:Poly-beta-hydroxybutyrate polymerase n=1 Tax=Rhodobaculum claviforme TaxID=1549854 RepID=A0A934TI39_9RHOB|nr:alpha/beta fold hydrolase [Rhodobaculum claviforme]MBK5926290.1 poly-beta-hydroxybutyrate polymerase [Rhodobaculum claviforme]